MIKVEDAKIFNIEGAITGMRFPMQSWEKSDSKHEFFGYLQQNGQLYSSEETKFVVGPNDLALARKLIKAGESHSKFMRQILVSMDITAPLYW